MRQIRSKVYQANFLLGTINDGEKVVRFISSRNVVCEKELYEEYSAKFSSNWNAKYIFRDLERLNPKFYLIPVKTVDTNIKEWITINDDFLSKEDAIKIYDKCGTLMHVSNPYGSQTDPHYYERMMPIWYKKIMNLLSQHLIRMVGGDQIYCIVMNGEKNHQGNQFVRDDEM